MRPFLAVFCFVQAAVLAGAAEEAAFVPPEPHPVDRYSAGWIKNPFTLKTAPQAMVKESFAKDLVLGSASKQSDGKFSVTVVNSKTRQRTTLTNESGKSKNEMHVKSVSISPDRKETSAEVELGGEVATLRFDETFLKQQLAANGQPGASGVPVASGIQIPGMPPLPQPQQPRPSVPGGPTAGMQPNPSTAPGLAQAGVARQQALNNLNPVNRRRVLTQPNPVRTQ